MNSFTCFIETLHANTEKALKEIPGAFSSSFKNTYSVPLFSVFVLATSFPTPLLLKTPRGYPGV